MKMVVGEILRQHPAVQIPQWDTYDDPAGPYFAGAQSPAAMSEYSPSAEYAAAFHRYLPSNYESNSDGESELLFDSFSCDEFRMYEFKVRRCVRGRSHDWTECPFAHPGEKARRRDPRRYRYSGSACPEFRKGACKKGDSCEFAHGVFECWLHPTRYRTQPCKDGTHCKRRVCFFAHSPDQLRVMPATESPPSPPLVFIDSVYSPERSPPSDSPPMSPPSGSAYGNFNSVGELVGAMRVLRVGSMGTGLSVSSPRCSSWGFGSGSGCSSGFGSPRSCAGFGPWVASGSSLPSTPTKIGAPARSGAVGLFDTWNLSLEEEPAMERVESGRDLRERMYAKLRMENSLDRAEPAGPVPDFRWISELVK